MARRRRGGRLLGGGLAAGLAATSACSSGGDGSRPEPALTSPPTDTVQAAGAPAPPIFQQPQPTAPTTPQFGNTTVTVGPVGPSRLPDEFLGSDVVHRSAPARRVLYSWTTDEQYQELRETPVLLTRSERPEVGGGLIRSVLADLAALGDPLSQALTMPAFERARYAWPNPWATLRGWPGESYGDRLIRIELRAEAWIMTLHVEQGGEATWQVYDMNDQPVDRRAAIEDPARIGAIFHMHEPSDPLVCGGTFFSESAGAFREYFLPNEAMVERWSLATEEMRDRLAEDIATLRDYRDDIAEGFGPSYWAPFVTEVACTWFGRTPLPGELSMEGTATNYLRSLAMASPLYEPTVANLDALIAALEDALFEPDPFVHEP
jgi:hypothetical protein